MGAQCFYIYGCSPGTLTRHINPSATAYLGTLHVNFYSPAFLTGKNDCSFERGKQDSTNSSKSNLKPPAEMRIKHRLSKSGIRGKKVGGFFFFLLFDLSLYSQPQGMSWTLPILARPRQLPYPVLISHKSIKFTSYYDIAIAQQHHRSISQASIPLPERFQHGWGNLTKMISAEGICLI